MGGSPLSLSPRIRSSLLDLAMAVIVYLCLCKGEMIGRECVTS